MKARLIVKKFGPIENVDLDLRNVNVFIGPQASGKSALAKIYTICKSPLSFYNKAGLFEDLNSSTTAKNDINVASFKQTLADYNILSFLNNDTLIEFDSELHYFKYENDLISYNRKFLIKIQELTKHSGADIRLAQKEIVEILSEFHDKLLYFDFFVRDFFKSETLINTGALKKYLTENELSQEQLDKIIEKIISLENELSSNTALYIPSERNFIAIIKGASLNLLNNNVPIPKHILSFGAEFEKATYEKKELDLNFLKPGLSYKNENGVDYIYYSLKKSVKLTESASGLQSIIPLLLPILSKREVNKLSHKSFVIEEAELNLFPKAQYDLIKILETDRFDAFSELQDIGTIHTYTTHSPYILSAFNNFLYASTVKSILFNKIYSRSNNFKEAYEIAENEVAKILPASIDAEYFSAYQICEGGATAIFNRETRLMKENYIDETTDEMTDDFDALMELTNKEI